MSKFCCRTLASLLIASCSGSAKQSSAERAVIALNGQWQIEDSISADQDPASWTHTVPVPGLTNLARPSFADVDAFDSKEVLWNRFRKGKVQEKNRWTPGIYDDVFLMLSDNPVIHCVHSACGYLNYTVNGPTPENWREETINVTHQLTQGTQVMVR